MRLGTNETGVVQIEIAARKFTPAVGNGPVIWLTAVSHIGEPHYYQALQRHLDAHALVLFEGIGGEAMQRARRTATNAPAKKSELSSLQTTIARSLGLVFQLDAIDYDRRHFRNSDVSMAELQSWIRGTNAIATSPGLPSQATPSGNDELQSLLKMMDASSAQGSLLQGLFQFIGANPRLQGLTKLVLMEVLAQLRGEIAQARGLPPQMQRLFRILIERRNETVLKDLKTEIARPHPAKSISLFYGAAHMIHFERQLRTMHYKTSEELWLPAFTLDLEKSGVGPFELGLIRTMVQMQMQKMFPAEEKSERN